MNIKKIILGVFGYMYMFRISFVKALFIPITILVILGYISIDQSELKLVIPLDILSTFIYIIIAITTHRIILLGPNSIPEWGIYIPRKRELHFTIYFIGLSLLTIPFIFISVQIPVIGLIISLLTISYLAARFSLVFPAIATDQNWSFSDSWKATKNYQFSMIIIVVIFPSIISLPEQILNYIPYMKILASLLAAITTVLTVAALSVAFQVITEKPATTSISLEKQ